MTSKLASLHAGLVARKGEAMPAQTNPHFSYVDRPRPDVMHTELEERRVERPRWPHPAAQMSAVEPHGDPDGEAAQVAPQPSQRTPDKDEAEWTADTDRRRSAPSPVRQSAHIYQRRATDVVQPVEAPAKSAEPQNDPNSDADHDPALRHRFTFRMSHEQRHRLRLAAAIRDQSLQTILSDALNNHLDGLCACSLKDCACMAAVETAQR